MKNAIENIKSTLSTTTGDLFRSLKLWRYWLYRAYVFHKLGYVDSKLGLLWPLISLLLVVVILGSVWSILFERSDGLYYYLYLLAGFPIWQFIAASVRQGVNVPTTGGKSDDLPFTIFLFERVSRNSINLLNVLPFVLIATLAIGSKNLIHWFWLPVALLSLLLWAIGVSALLSALVALRPDVKHLVQAFMRLAFLATPIVWEPSRLGEYVDYVWINPFFAPLEFARYGITGMSDFPEIVWIAPTYSFALFLFGLLVFARFITLFKARLAGS